MKNNKSHTAAPFELPVMRKVCQECKVHNPADAKFCRNCKSTQISITIVYLKLW